MIKRITSPGLRVMIPAQRPITGEPLTDEELLETAKRAMLKLVRKLQFSSLEIEEIGNLESPTKRRE